MEGSLEGGGGSSEEWVVKEYHDVFFLSLSFFQFARALKDFMDKQKMHGFNVSLLYLF